MLLDIVWKYPKERLKNHMRIKGSGRKKRLQKEKISKHNRSKQIRK